MRMKIVNGTTTLGELLADMVYYGDIHEAVFPQTWDKKLQQMGVDEEMHTRCAIAATLLKLTFNGPGGSCKSEKQDAEIGCLLRQIVTLEDYK